MKTIAMTVAAGAALLAASIGFSGEARAQCLWTGVSWACPSPFVYHPQPFGGFDGFYGPTHHRGFFNLSRPDAFYPGPPLTGSSS